jgi:sulfite reductase (NADPH) hemoprotein beta-component
MNDTTKTTSAVSAAEVIKSESNFLRGTIKESLADAVTGAVADADQILLKFHGTYQQDDRDVRLERQKQKLEPDYGFMIRARITGGVIAAEQWLALDDIATRYAKDSIRLTTRQTVQYHRVEKKDLKAAIQAINEIQLTTIAACGDVNRNVLSATNPTLSEAHAETYRLAGAISDHLIPETGAYSDIWLDGKPLYGKQKANSGSPESEPIYGKTYLPRKFKIALAVPPDNDVDVYANDLGYVAIVEQGKLLGYNVLVGGGMGMSHGDTKTYPNAARVIGMCTPEQVVAVAEQVVTVQRDYGNRQERKNARLKYTIDRHGLAWFREEVERRLGFELQQARPFHFNTTADQPGWRQDSSGLWHWCVHIMSGRISDTGEQRYLSGFRAIAKALGCGFIMTANQNLVLSGIRDEDKARLEALAAEYGIAADANWTPFRRQAMACVGLPTCALAMAESERALPDFVQRIESVMQQCGLEQRAITMRITGCPNGCARPYLAEIGLVGKGPGHYNLYLGAAADGSRLNKLYRENISEDAVIAELEPLLQRYAQEGLEEEAFGDFLIRSQLIKAVTEGRLFHD